MNPWPKERFLTIRTLISRLYGYPEFPYDAKVLETDEEARICLLNKKTGSQVSQTVITLQDLKKMLVAASGGDVVRFIDERVKASISPKVNFRIGKRSPKKLQITQEWPYAPAF